jgi:hypothetical protein
MTAQIGLRANVAELLRYFAVSGVALAVDTTALLASANFVHYLWAATLGFLLGAVTSYLLSVRWVFRHRRLAAFPKTEFAAFAAVGVAALKKKGAGSNLIQPSPILSDHRGCGKSKPRLSQGVGVFHVGTS